MEERKQPFSFSFTEAELLSHYFYMNESERHSDFDEGLQCIMKKSVEGSSFGAKLVRKAKSAMETQQATNRKNVQLRWIRDELVSKGVKNPTDLQINEIWNERFSKQESTRADAGEGDLPVRNSDASTARTSACSLSAGDAANPPRPAELVTAGGLSSDERGADGSTTISASTPRDHAVRPSAGRDVFEAFRKAYPGTRRGADVEWDNFSRKNPAEAVALLMPALLREKAHKAECARVGAFCPEWAHLSTWINQRRWTQEFERPVPPQVRATAQDIENRRKANILRELNGESVIPESGMTEIEADDD